MKIRHIALGAAAIAATALPMLASVTPAHAGPYDGWEPCSGGCGGHDVAGIKAPAGSAAAQIDITGVKNAKPAGDDVTAMTDITGVHAPIHAAGGGDDITAADDVA